MSVTQRIQLPDRFSNHLIKMPESGMGYQLVKVFLKGGKILHNLKVLNSSILLVEKGESVHKEDIENIEIEA